MSAGAQKMLVTLEQDDLSWLDTTVGTLKGLRRRTNKSEVIRVGLKLLREKTLDELRALLRDLD